MKKGGNGGEGRKKKLRRAGGAVDRRRCRPPVSSQFELSENHFTERRTRSKQAHPAPEPGT